MSENSVSMTDVTKEVTSCISTACTALEDFSRLTGLPMRLILATMYNDCFNEVGRAARLCPEEIGFDVFVSAFTTNLRPLPDEI